MHHEKILMEMQAQQRERDKEWQQEQKRQEREWQQEQKRQEREWQQAQKAEERRYQTRWRLWLLVLGPLVGAIIALGSAKLQQMLQQPATPSPANAKEQPAGPK